jgi:hypothetical protein
MSLMFLFLQFIARLLICLSDIPSFYSWNACRLHVSYCSDYLHSFPLDPVTTGIWLVSFDLIIISILRPSMAHAYGSSIRNKIESHWLKCLYSVTVSQALVWVISTSASKSQHTAAFYPIPRLISCDWTSLYEICVVFVYLALVCP